ncbi:MAG: STAS domain-containing protein [Aquihabitans sp.]
MDLRIDVAEHGDWSVLQIRGEIDIATAPRLREQLISLVNDQRYQLVVDMEAVEFIDSTGLGVLIGALKRVRAHDGDLQVVLTNTRILKVFEITQLDTIFRISPTLDAVVAG